MDFASYEFNSHGLFSIDGRRQNRAFLLAEILVESVQNKESKFSSFISDCPDDSVLDALVYELLRLCIVRSEDYSRNFKTPKSSRQYEDKLKTLKKSFSDQKFCYLTAVADHFGFSDQFIVELMQLQRLVHQPDFKIRREVCSGNINWKAEHMGSIPTWVPPAKIRDGLFTYRWSLILGEYLGFSRTKSVELYGQFRRYFTRYAKDCRDRSRREILDVISPCLPSESDIETCLKRVADDLNKPWSLEFMHMDYAGLLRWELLSDLKSPPRITHFVADVLGAHILDARFVNGWSPDDKEWTGFLTSQGTSKVKNLRQIYARDFNDDQSVEVTFRCAPEKIEKRWCAFNYLPKIHPDKYPKNCNLKLIDPIDMYETRLPIPDVIPRMK